MVACVRLWLTTILTISVHASRSSPQEVESMFPLLNLGWP